MGAMAKRAGEERGSRASAGGGQAQGRGKLALSIEDAARAISVSRDSFERHVITELRVLRLGRRLLVPVAELERFVERRSADPLIADLAAISSRRGTGHGR